MKQYIAIIAFGLGIISYAQHGPRSHHPPKKIEKFHSKKRPHHSRFEKHHHKGSKRPHVVYYQPTPIYQHIPVPHHPKGVNINVSIR